MIPLLLLLAQITTTPPPPDLPRPNLKQRLAGLVDTTPADTPVAIGFCSQDQYSAHWRELAPDNQWYLVTIDGVQAPWGGVLVGDGTGCYSTEKRYTFAQGSHNVVVKLVIPGTIVRETDPPLTACPGCDRCQLGIDCYGLGSDPLGVVAGTPPPPVDCVVSDWGPWSAWSDWTQNSPTTEQRTRTHSRTVTTAPENGGAACPALSESESETRPYNPPPPVDPCVDTPLKVIVQKWPTGQDGTRQGQWNSGVFRLTSARFEWTPLRFTAIDTRGCTATVTK